MFVFRPFLLAAFLLSFGGCTSDPPPAASTPPGSTPAASSGSTAAALGAAGPKPVLNDWFALGSGCRSKFDAPGDVSMELLAVDAARPELHRARFVLGKYVLDTNALPKPSPLTFARECAVRLNVNPPEGKRIVGVAARTRVRASKSSDVKLTVHGELKLGTQTLGKRTTVHERGAPLDEALEVYELRPGTRADETLPSLRCGEPKIVAFNYTWIADRVAASDTANVYVGGDRALELDVELEGCP